MAGRFRIREGHLKQKTTFWLVLQVLVTSMALGQSGDEAPLGDTLQRVEKLVEQGELQEAEQLVRNELADSEPPDLLGTLADILVQRSQSLDWTSSLGRHLGEGMVREALSLADQLAATGAADRDWRPRAAHCHRLLGQPEKALGILKEWALGGGNATQDDLAVACEASLDLLATLGRLDEARGFLADIVTLESLAHARLELKLAAWSRDRVTARRAARSLVKMPDADLFEVSSLCWDAYSDAEDWKEPLLLLYTSLISERGQDPDLRFYRGATLYYAGDHAAAEADLQMAGAARAGSTMVNRYLGLTWIRQGRLEEATELFRGLLESGGGRQALDGLITVAVEHGRSNRFDLAEELYRDVLKIDPANEWAHVGLPLCYKGRGDLEQAEVAYRAGLEALPEHAQLHNDLALLLWGAGRREEAREWFERGMSAGALDSTENLGMIAFSVDRRPDAASEYFAAVLRQDPQRVKSRFYRELSLLETR